MADKSNKMRVTTHRGRGKNGVAYDPKHNDRNFDLSKADHIDPERSKDNFYWHTYSKENLTFEEVEKRFYEEHFSKNLEEKNQRYAKSGHKERCKTMDQYRTNMRSCPEEIINQVGNKECGIDATELRKIMIEYTNWHIKKFPSFKVLDLAVHVDEGGCCHCQTRGVWVTKDPNGNEKVSQTQALKDMGIELPDPTKKEGRQNNRKTTYTKICRDHFIKICKSHGLEIETTPRDAGESGLTLTAYQNKKELEKLEQLQKETKALTEGKEPLYVEISNLKKEKKALTSETSHLEERNTKLKEANKDLEKRFANLINNIAEAQKLATDVVDRFVSHIKASGVGKFVVDKVLDALPGFLANERRRAERINQLWSVPTQNKDTVEKEKNKSTKGYDDD